MFVTCKQAVTIRAEQGERFSMPAGYLGEVPDWVGGHWYFKALCESGTVAAVESAKDKAVETAQQKAAAAKRAKEQKEQLAAAVDAAKNQAKQEAEAEGKEKGLDEGSLKKLIAEKQEAAEQVTREQFQQ